MTSVARTPYDRFYSDHSTLDFLCRNEATTVRNLVPRLRPGIKLRGHWKIGRMEFQERWIRLVESSVLCMFSCVYIFVARVFRLAQGNNILNFGAWVYWRWLRLTTRLFVDTSKPSKKKLYRHDDQPRLLRFNKHATYPAPLQSITHPCKNSNPIYTHASVNLEKKAKIPVSKQRTSPAKHNPG